MNLTFFLLGRKGTMKGVSAAGEKVRKLQLQINLDKLAKKKGARTKGELR